MVLVLVAPLCAEPPASKVVKETWAPNGEVEMLAVAHSRVRADNRTRSDFSMADLPTGARMATRRGHTAGEWTVAGEVYRGLVKW